MRNGLTQVGEPKIGEQAQRGSCLFLIDIFLSGQ
jgi:hypothetical protein